MSIFRKTHFWYNKSQRNGIFFLLLIIIGLQLGYFFIDFTGKKGISATEKEWFYLEKETDSLQKLTQKTVKIYPFNPNFISDFKGYSLGMSTIELDRLYRFRKQGKYVNSAKEFQRVTKISDTLLSKIQGYFKFPKWTTKKQVVFTPKKAVSIRDINKVLFLLRKRQFLFEILTKLIPLIYK